MPLKKNQSIYFKKATQELVESKIDLHFSRTKRVDDCGGYFCPETKSLSVATWNKDWFSIFAHEYNHFLQWKTQTKLWSSVESIDFFDNYPSRYLLSTQLMEQECDKMLFMDIKKFNIEGMKNHVAESNSYHLSYVNMVENKKFIEKAPYRYKEIVDLCPNDRFFNIKELRNPDAKIYKLINKLCFVA